ncbi:MAG TPA: DUF58 domain-containing protein [Acidimicrobiales bacterium]|nr:DUF58 domain-containing protein [Acidimicrobiales bacterium]
MSSGHPGFAQQVPSRTGRGWVAARPTRRSALIVAAVAVLTVALPLGVVVPGLVLCAVVGCALVDVVVAGRARPQATRSDVPTLSLRVAVGYSLEAQSSAGHMARLRQPVPAELEVDPDEVPGASLHGSLLGLHRGTHQLAPAVLRVGGPLGLGTCDHAVGDAVAVTVMPDLPKARRMADARRRGRTGEAGRVRTHLGMGTEFESIRDYTPDDDIRHVNWVATGRAGRPMANQFRVDENREVLCVVDTGRLMASPVGELTRLDVALDAMTVLAVAAEDSGDRVGAMAFDSRVTRQLAPRRRGAEALVRALFDLEPSEVESDYERTFAALGRHRRALVALFTDIVDASASRSLLDASPVLARRHTVLVASCRDPDLTAAVRSEPQQVKDVLRAAVALELLRAHDESVARLRALGVTVVSAPAQQLGPACARAYLRLKQRARL